MALAAGTKLGPYEIASAVGAGGMGEVYRARDTRLERTVAIKILPAHLSSDAALRQRFELEARAVSSLNHPQICALYDVGQQDGVSFLVMEYLEGESLAQRLEKGPLPIEQVLKYGMQIADALDKAHRQGIIHRDLKPGNVMLTAGGAKLLDFGLAKTNMPAAVAAVSSWSVVPTQISPVTQAGTVVGTFQYMSPEQVEGREVDARSDLFAFGAMLYEMVTGKRAFQGKSSLSVASAILEKEPEPITTLAPMTPPALERAIRRCLAKDPEERWQTARDLLLELKWIAEAGSQAGVPAVVSSRRRLSQRVWIAAAALLLVTSAVLGALYYRSVTQEPMVVRAAIPAPPGTSFRFGGGGLAGPMAISPDGRMLAFTAQREDGVQHVYLRALDSNEAQPLAGTEGGAMPFWSADSRRIGFFADGKLKTIEASGGPALTLCEVGVVPRGGSWSSNGTIIFSTGPIDPLWSIPESGGEPTALTALDRSRNDSSHRWPHILPDGNHFLLYVRIGAPGVPNENTGVYLGSLDGKPPQLLLRTTSNAIYAAGYLLFLRESTLMAQPFDAARLQLSGEAVAITQQVQSDSGASSAIFSASGNVLVYQTGEAQVGSLLHWHDRAGKQLGTVGDQAVYMDFAVSPDGQKVAVSVIDPRFGPPDTWILERGLRSRFTFDPAADRYPVWSPDGSQLVFNSNRRGHWDLYIKAYAGSRDEEVLLADDMEKFPSDWSRDGRYLLFDVRGGPFDLWALPMFGERKPFPILQTKFREMDAVFSPDGRWIAYQSDETGRMEIYVTSFPTPGRKWQISPNGGTRAQWSRNGKEIYYLEPGDRLVAVEVSARGDDFQAGRMQPLFTLRAQRPGLVYHAAPDDRRFLVNTATQSRTSDPMTVVVNWTAELKKKR